MALVSLGKKTVATAGTIVQVTTTVTNCNGVFIQALASNTGNMFVGLSNLVASTLVGCLRVILFPPTTPSKLDSWDPQSGVSVGPIDLSTLWLDAAVNGNGVLITYIVC